MKMKDTGFTLVELLISMVIFIILIAATARLFITAASQLKHQGMMTETYMEGMIGLQQFKTDIKHGGTGLPWSLTWDTGSATYNEAINSGLTNYNDTLLNGIPGITTGITAVPRAFVSLNNAGLNGSDVLSIKAVNVGMSDASQRYTRVGYGDNLLGDPDIRGLSGDSFAANDRVIVLYVKTEENNNDNFALINTAFCCTTYSLAPTPPDFYSKYIIYGVDPDSALRMPFNRADYYIEVPAAPENLPSGCAAGTGILYKATVNHGNGNLNPLPLIDCVADMQVIYRLDMDGNGTIGTTSNADGTTINTNEGATTATVQATLDSAADLRSRLKEIRVYILAQEGQRDARYTFPDATVTVGDAAFGQVFDFAARGIANWQNYRWRVYTLAVNPLNLNP